MQPHHAFTRMYQRIGPHVVLTLPLALLIAINLLPIAGAFQFGWNLYALLLLYWAENALIGLYTIAKIVTASKQSALGKSRSYQIIFFITHYSTFWVLHGVVLVSVFQMAGARFHGVALLFFAAIILYAVQHGVSYRVNWMGAREFEGMSPTETMVLPYFRVQGVLLLTLIGGIAVSQIGEAPVALATLASLKLVVDAASHVYIHRVLAARAASAAD